MNVQFLTSVAPIVLKPEASRSFYGDALGLRGSDLLDVPVLARFFRMC
jgi:catechol 2,3-dioxygenase-like lactoylglutathione lyase family enzyme